MFGRSSRLRRALRSVVAWLGLGLMIVCFAWWQLSSKPQVASAPPPTPPPKAELFSVVVLDPGHGGQDSGAMCAGILEKDLTLDIAQRLDRLLQSQGLATVMTRVGDAYVSLADRAALTNRVPNCVLVSIHFNEAGKAVSSSGIETYYPEHPIPVGAPLVSWLPFLQRAAAVTQAPDVESQSLAGFVQEALVVRTQSVNRGTKAKQFFVIANVRHPAVLIEGGFLTNKEEIARLASAEYRDQVAAAISEGVLRYREVKDQQQRAFAATAAAPPPANNR